MNNAVRVLLVEDDALIALAMEMQLKREGYSVCSRVATGEDAIVSAQSKAPDIILMDIRLAGNIDGVEASCKIREFSDVPIIFLTGYQDPATEKRAQAVNPLAYLIKPADFHILQMLLDSAK